MQYFGEYCSSGHYHFLKVKIHVILYFGLGLYSYMNHRRPSNPGWFFLAYFPPSFSLFGGLLGSSSSLPVLHISFFLLSWDHFLHSSSCLLKLLFFEALPLLGLEYILFLYFSFTVKQVWGDGNSYVPSLYLLALLLFQRRVQMN